MAETLSIIIQAKDQFSKTFGRAGLTIENFNKAAIAAGAVAAGIGIALKKSIDKAISFESAFAGVKKTVDATDTEFTQLDKNLKDLTKTIPVTYEDLAGITEIAGQLGVEGVDNLTKFTKTVADISATTNLTAEAAATDFARIANIMQEPLDNVDKMGAAVVDLGNNFATTETEISTFAQRIAGAGNIAGLTTSDIFGIGAAMSSVGVQAEAGGTATQKVLLGINEAVTTSSDKLDVFANTAGMNVDEFSTLWKEDASKAFENFVLGLGKQGDNAIKTLDDLGLKDQRLVRSFLSLANAGDLISETLNTSATAWEENSALTAEAQKRYETLQSQIDIAKNKLFLIGAELGEKLVPIIKNYVLPALDWLINLWQSLSPEIQNAILIGTAVAGVILAIAAAVAIVNLVMSPWLLIIFAIAAAIGLLVAAGYLMYKKWDKIKDWMIGVWDAIKEGVKEAINFMIGMVEKYVNFWIKGVNMIIGALNKIQVSIPDWVPGLGGNTFGINISKVPELSLPRLADGGIITKPTTALIGEEGPEAVIPLNRRNSAMGNNITINIENINGLDPQEVAEALEDVLRNKIQF